MGVIAAPVSKIALVLLDCRHAPDWVQSLVESRVVRQHAPNHYVEYNRVGMPFIVNDREFVTDVRMEIAVERTVKDSVSEARPKDEQGHD